MKEEPQKYITFTKKGKDLATAINEAFNEWLIAGNLTIDEFLKYKDVKGFHITTEDEGYYLAYYKDGIEEQIGCGLYKGQRYTAEWIFAYACALLDKETNYSGKFTKEYSKWGDRNER